MSVDEYLAESRLVGPGDRDRMILSTAPRDEIRRRTDQLFSFD